jgi:hypothetical protein
MGVIGNVIGQEAGGGLGRLIGSSVGGRRGGDAGANIGRVIGGVGGSAFPFFKKGGKIPGKKGMPKVIVAHAGEYVIPNGIRVPKSVKAAVKKLKAKK